MSSNASSVRQLAQGGDGVSGMGMELREKDKITLCVSRGGGGSGTRDYNALFNKPRALGHEWIGDKTFVEMGLGYVSDQEIDDVFDEVFYGG